MGYLKVLPIVIKIYAQTYIQLTSRTNIYLQKNFSKFGFGEKERRKVFLNNKHNLQFNEYFFIKISKLLLFAQKRSYLCKIIFCSFSIAAIETFIWPFKLFLKISNIKTVNLKDK